MADLQPTPKLRWVTRRDSQRPGTYVVQQILQQWFAEDMPGYMRDKAKGEWRDVDVVDESG